MKEIQPKTIWVNGSDYIATTILYYGTFDNQINQSIFFYALFTGTTEQIGQKLVEGNLTMDLPDYEDYKTSTDSSLYAQNWVSNKLGVTII